jgi:hypothetical protein
MSKVNFFAKISAFFIWLSMLSGVTYALLHEQELFQIRSQSVAKMTSKSGDILYREEGLVRWRETVENQEFSDGDWIVTGPGSLATIAFKSGQVLKLGSDTQIQIRGILQGKSEYSYMVTLSKGAVVAEVTENRHHVGREVRGGSNDGNFDESVGQSYKSQVELKPSHGMVIRSGNRSFTVDQGKKLGLVKERGTNEITKVSEKILSSNIFNKDRVSKVDALDADVLPPSARSFSGKIGSIVVTKEAVLSKTNVPFEAGRAHASNGFGLGQTDPGSIEMAQTQRELEQPKLSRADLTALSESLFSSTGGVASDNRPLVSNNKMFDESVSIASKKSKNTDNLPVLKLKDKIDRLDVGMDSSKDSNVGRVKRTDKNGVYPNGKVFSLSSKAITSAKDFKKSSSAESEGNSLKNISGIDFEHYLHLDNRLLNISAYKSISSLKNSKIKVSLLPPKKRPLAGQLRPIVELVGKQGTKIPLVEGNANGDLEVFLPLDLVIKYGREKVSGAFKEYEVSARAGSEWTINGEKAYAFERVFSVIKVTGFAGGASQGITVGLDRFDTDRSGSASNFKQNEIAPEKAPIRISLQSEDDFSLISPFVAKASHVGFGKGGPRDDLGYFVVRNRAVIAEVSGSGLTRIVLQNILSVLRGDFVFRGFKNALHEPSDKSQRDITTWVDSLLDQGKVLYVMKRSRLYPVSREFVKTNNEVARFIDSQAKAVFVEKVDVIVYR